MLAAGLAACGGGDDHDDKRTTVLVYMLGSDLESRDGQATHNLKELLSVPSTPRVRVLITTGGANKVDPQGLVSSWKTVKRFEQADGRLNELLDLGERNMDDAATLQDFLTWGCRTAPAERYMLMMWDHGGGYTGFGQDENFPAAGGPMQVAPMASALRAFQQSSGITLDYIGFDACLMATVEVAHMLQPYTRFMGASQELEPGSGWDWQANARTLASQPSIDAVDFGRASAEAFVAKQEREHEGHPLKQIMGEYVTFSITDMAQVPALMTRLDTWARAVLASYEPGATSAALAKAARLNPVFWPPLLGADQETAAAKAASADTDPVVEHFKLISLQRLRAASFGAEALSRPEQPTRDLVDLSDFAALLAAEGIATAEQQALQEALSRTVRFNATGPRATHAGGLSIYFPKASRIEYLARLYASLDMPAGHLALIERHLNQNKIRPSVIDVSALSVHALEPSLVEATVASLYGVQEADLLLVRASQGAPARIIGTLPLAAGKALPEGVVLFHTDSWLLLDGQPVLLETLRYEAATAEHGPAYSLGAPVRLSRASGGPSELALLIMRVTRDEEGELQGVILGTQNLDLDDPGALPDRVDTGLAPGDVLEPIHLFYDLERNAPHEEDGRLVIAMGEPITLTEKSGLATGPLPSGQHQLCVMATDYTDEDAISPVLDYAKP